MKNKSIIGLLIALVAIFGVILLVRTSSTETATVEKVSNNTLVDDGHHADDSAPSYEIYPGDVTKKIQNKENVTLLDVRTLKEYEEIHLENALLLPVEELSQQTLNAIGLGQNKKDEEIIIYCRSGARSKIAYDVMKSLGYTNIKSSAGGMIHWQEDNYPFTESGAYNGPKWSSNSQDNEVVPTDGPKITIDNPFYDFGVIPQYGGIVTKEFTVRNSGTKNLEIGNLTTSCSCTSATISSSSIAPGGSATLTVVFDPDFHEEPLDVFKRTVFIPSNDPTTPEAEVVIQTDIAEGN